jgi:hypothetical protein
LSKEGVRSICVFCFKKTTKSKRRNQ